MPNIIKNLPEKEKLIFAKPKALKEVKDWLAFYDKFWNDKLDSLGKHLDSIA